MRTDTAYLNTLWGQLMAEELARNGIRHVCIAPGSRSTPLVAALARHPEIKTQVIVDERQGAFVALGVGRATGVPGVLVTTSGTAAAHALPAVIEANQSAIPLLILSADRPPELRDTGANQTIEQRSLFQGQCRYVADVPCPDPNHPPRALLSLIDYAIHRASHGHPGPVHLNLMFRKPLDPISPAPPWPESIPKRWRRSSQPLTTYGEPVLKIQDDDVSSLAEVLNAAKRGVMVIGALEDPLEIHAAHRLAQALGWPLWADISSQLPLGCPPLKSSVHLDLLLRSKPMKNGLRPDVILRLGGPLISKGVEDWVGACEEAQVISIERRPGRRDPAWNVGWRLQAHIAPLADSLMPLLKSEGASTALANVYGQRSLLAQGALEHALESQNTLSEMTLPRAVLEGLGHGHTFVVSNSMPIRDMDVFGRLAEPRGHQVIANRGASGIDGLVACALGIALGKGAPVTLIIGDLALEHDISSLRLLRDTQAEVTVVVINNGGGGIFSFLPIHKEADIFPAHFAAAHSAEFEGRAKAYDIPYAKPSTVEGLHQALAHTQERPGPSLIEIRTSRSENLTLHREAFAAVTSALEPTS